MANSAVVGMLRAILQLDTAEFEAGGKRAVTAAKGVGDSLSTSLGPGAKSAGGFVDNLNTSLGKVGLSLQSLSVAGATAMLVGLGREAMSAASNFMDLRDRTGLTLQELQRLEVAGAQVGVSLDQAARGVGVLQRNLVGGDKGAVEALKKLNLNVSELLEMTPGAMFEEISRAIAKVPDPTQRAALAYEILGRTGQQLLPLLLANIDKLNEGTKKMSDSAIENMDRWDDTWKVFKLNLRASAGEMLGMFADAKEGFGGVQQAVAENLGPMAQLWGAIQRARRESEVFTAALGDQGLEGALTRLRETAAKTGGPLGDVFDRMKRDLPDIKEVQAEFDRSNKANEDQLKKNIAAYEAYRESVRNLANEFTGKALAEKVKLQADALKLAGGEAKLSAFEHQKLGETLAKLRAEGAILTPELQKIYAAHLSVVTAGVKVDGTLQSIIATLPNYADAWRKANDPVWEAVRALDAITVSGSQAIREMNRIVGEIGREVTTLGPRAATGFAADLKGAIAAVPQTILGAVMGGGNVGGAIGGLFGGALTKRLGETVGKSLSKSFLSESLGGAIGSIIPGLGTLLGAGLGGLIGKIFGPTEGMKTNDLRDSWMAQMGGLQKIQKLIGDFNNDPVLMSTFQRLYSTGTQKQFQAAAEAFEKRMRELMGEREDAQARLNAALQKYGFTIDELGPKWKAQQLTDQAKELVLDYTALVASGIDVETVITRMGGAMNEFVQSAIRTGTEIPLEMRPMIEKMIEMGLLTDENGVAFTSLEDAGITFAETLSAGFDRVIAKLDQLIRAITDDLGNAIDDIPPIDVEVTPRWGQLPRIQAPDLEEPVVFDSPMKRITGSGLAWLNPGDVAGMPELTPEFSGAFGGGMMTIIQTLEGREVTRAIVPYLPGEVRRLGLTKV